MLSISFPREFTSGGKQRLLLERIIQVWGKGKDTVVYHENAAPF
jgi:hypothetical protein